VETSRAAVLYLLRAAPQAPAAWFGLARLYLLEGKFEQSEIWAQKIMDSGQADDIAKKMLEAAKAKQLSEELRRLIEPPPAAPNLTFGSTTNFFIGQSFFPKGDSIEITSVERSENQMAGKVGDSLNPRGVKIRYKLVQNPVAQLPKPVTVTGEVTDQNGKPLANVRWRISAVEEWRDGQWELIHNLGWPQWSVTDSEGRFTLTFQGRQRFDLQFAGFGELAPGFVYEVSPDTRDLKIVMKPGIPVRGTVVASNSNRIPGYVRVELQLPCRDVWYQEESATDADGHFTFYVCPPPTEPNKAIPSKWQISCAGLVTPFEAEGKSIGMNLLVDARAEIVVNTNTSVSTTPPVAASTPKPDGSPTADASKAAVSAAENWLALIDDGNYTQSWKDAGLFFQAAVTAPSWTTAMESFRKPLGNLVSRKLKSAQPATSLPGAPDGQYVVMQFETSFADKKSAVETVTFALEKDGQWRSTGYFIK